MILVQLSDFSGFHSLARSIPNDEILQAYIDRYEANYIKYIFGTQTKHSQSGVTINQSEVANNNSPENAARFGEQKWNDSLSSIAAIQWYCYIFAPQDYPDFNGQCFEAKFSPIV